jgi:hypothetical protein
MAIISESGVFLHATLRRLRASNACERESDALWDRTLSARKSLFLPSPLFFLFFDPVEDVVFDLLWIESKSGPLALDANTAVECKECRGREPTEENFTLSMVFEP